MPSGMVGADARVWDLLRAWNRSRMEKSKRLDSGVDKERTKRRMGFDPQAARDANIPYSSQQTDSMHDALRNQFLPGEQAGIPDMDVLTAQDNPAYPVQPPTMPGTAPTPSPDTSSVAATGPGAAPSPQMGPPQARGGTDAYQSPLDELDPEMLEQIMQGEALQEQLQYAQGLRDKAMPEGRYTSGGRMYTASSPIEHAATAYGKVRGSRDVKKTQGKQADIRTSILDLLRGKGKIATPPIIPQKPGSGGYRGLM